MNLTVGPLPPAVYWRRRAIVFGGILLVVLLIAYSCSGSGTSNTSSQGSGGSGKSLAPIGVVTVPVTPPASSPSVFPPTTPATSTTPTAPAIGSTPTVSVPPTGTGATTTPAIATCTDAQIRVTPVIASTSPTSPKLVHGGTYDLKLKVRNISAVPCRRDVGSVPESLVVTQGSTKIWSSDDCVKAVKAHDVRTFAPNIEIFADVKWSSYDITTTTCKKSTTPAPIGKYTLTGTVGTAKATVPFSIVS